MFQSFTPSDVRAIFEQSRINIEIEKSILQLITELAVKSGDPHKIETPAAQLDISRGSTVHKRCYW